MPEILTPLLPEYTINLPEDPIAWILWFVIFGIIIAFITRMREKPLRIKRDGLIWIALLSVSILVFTPFLGIPVELETGHISGQEQTHHMMFLAALPWLAAGGMIGIIPACLLSGMSGLLFAYLETHHIFTPLVFMSMAVLFTWGVRQRYRTTFYRLLRFPLVSALFSIIAVTPLIFLSQVLIQSNDFPSCIAIASARMPSILMAYAGMLGVGSIICTLIRVIFSEKWGGQSPIVSAPGEKSIKTRFLLNTVPILFILLSFFISMVWHRNVVSSRRELVSQLVSTSEVAAKGWSVFLDTGLIMIGGIGEEIQQLQRLGGSVDQGLSEALTKSAFFYSLSIITTDGEVIARVSQDSFDMSVEIPGGLFLQEDDLEYETLRVVTTQSAFISPMVSFISDHSGADRSGWVLWGEAAVADNRFSQLITATLASLEVIDGDGAIINTEGLVLYSTEQARAFGIESDSITATPNFSEIASADGIYLMQYNFPIEDSEWAVVTTLPASRVYDSAWNMSAPNIFFALGVFAFFITTSVLVFSSIITDIDLITGQLKSAMDGRFDVNLSAARSKGELSRLFEQVHSLFASLGKQIQKQEELLLLNDQLADHGDLQDSLHTIMTTALNRGVSSVRIIVKNTASKSKFRSGKMVYSLGEGADSYAHLDEELSAIVRSQGEVIWQDFQIMKNLPQTKGLSTPSSLCALPLEWKGADLGLFWAASHNKKSLNIGVVDLLRTLSSKAAVIVAKAMTYDHAIALQDQLESVLELLSDGILLLDTVNRVIYHNRAARLMFSIKEDAINHQQLDSIIRDQSLFELIKKIKITGESEDWMAADDKIYRITSQPIDLGTTQKGMLLIFKDITSVKNQESTKSEYVITASHELRSPLALVHGYAKLLRVTGNLNEQQDAYISHIIDSIEEMKMLVTNLLDIERLEAGDALEVRRLNAQDLAKSVFTRMQTQAKQKNIHLDLNLPDSPIAFEGDQTFLSQALKNLIDNAIKFTKMGGDVSLNLRKNEDSLVFAVKDNGIGIAPLDQRHLFEKFTRVSTGLSQESKGSGLGLAIVKSIVERHGGKVWFESQLGQGSTFYLEIPLKHRREALF